MAEINIPTGPIEDEPSRAIRVERPETLSGAAREALYAALAGVELGAYDRRIIDWLAMYGDLSTMAVVCSWLGRVRNLKEDRTMAELIEYGCRWTDWDNRSDEHKTRVRIEVGGYGDEGRMTAEHVASQTRRWQPNHGLPADAVVVSRPIGEWTVVESEVSE